MKIQRTVFSHVLIILVTILIASISYAGSTIRVEKDVPYSDLAGVPVNVTFNIYDSEVAGVLVASETFPSGTWWVDYDFTQYKTAVVNMVRFKADFTNTTVLSISTELWLEIDLDGVVIGLREQIKQETWSFFSEEAVYAYNADTVDGIDSADLEESAEIDSDITTHAGLPGVHHTKTTSFTDLTDQASNSQIPVPLNLSGTAPVIKGTDSSSGNYGYFGSSSYGVYGYSNSDYGVYGKQNVSGNSGYLGGNSCGVYGRHNSGNYGALGSTGYGVYGNSASGRGVFGASSSGIGGYFSSSTGYGLIVENGNVGIGTTSPGSKLHILQSNGSQTGYFETSGTQNWIGFYTGNGYIGYSGVWSGSDDIDIGTGVGNATGSVNLVIGATPKLTVNQNGNVGIGTTNPVALLDIKSSVAGADPLQKWRADDDELIAMLYKNDSDSGVFQIYDNGSPTIQLAGNGTIRTKVLEITGGSDIAEPFDFSDADAIKPGMVVAIDPDQPGQLKIAEKAYDRTVAGIVSGANGINPGLTMSQEGTVADGALPVALTGRVYAWADASNGAIQPGDLLTTSTTPGHIMKVTDHAKAQGAIIGKAMTLLEKGKGLVLVLVTLQ